MKGGDVMDKILLIIGIISIPLINIFKGIYAEEIEIKWLGFYLKIKNKEKRPEDSAKSSRRNKNIQ